MQTLPPSKQQTFHATARVTRSPRPPRRLDLDPRTISVMVAGAAFLVVLLVINRDLFTKPIMAYSDFAFNGLQVERAKHFRDLLGNYSRWGFHHPGPAFMYLWAFGEAFFHDLLHLTPAVMNAHMLTTILLNTAFLFGTIGIVARRCKSFLFTPVALGLSLFFIYILNHTVPASAVLSIWMPHVLLFPFLFFVAVSVSVSLGEISKMPWFVLTGLLLLHGHVAQPLFVGPIFLLTLAILWRRKIRLEGAREFLKTNRRAMAVSFALVVLFALPILIEIVIHRPNNIRAIIDYTSTHKGIQNKPRIALKYELSFLDFTPSPEGELQQHPTRFMSMAGAKPYVAMYWCLGCLMLGLLIGIYVRRDTEIPAFFKCLGAEILLVQLLFYIWSLKMAPPLFNFNGYFIYSMQLLALFAAAALILDGLRLTLHPAIAVAVCALVPLSMFAAKTGFINTWTGDSETERIYASIPTDVGPVHLLFPPDESLTIVGVADRMEHEHRFFCLDDIFKWGPEPCHSLDHLRNIVITRTPLACESPCRVLLKDDRFQVSLIPYPKFHIPFAIKPDNIFTLNTNFFGNDQAPIWSSRKSSVYFRLAPDFTDAAHIRITVFGDAIPGRPARIILNSRPIGTIVAGSSRSEFVVDRSALLPDSNNGLTIQVDKAVRAGADPRALGFLWSGLAFDAAN